MPLTESAAANRLFDLPLHVIKGIAQREVDILIAAAIGHEGATVEPRFDSDAETSTLPVVTLGLGNDDSAGVQVRPVLQQVIQAAAR